MRTIPAFLFVDLLQIFWSIRTILEFLFVVFVKPIIMVKKFESLKTQVKKCPKNCFMAKKKKFHYWTDIKVEEKNRVKPVCTV